jgi:hypothetical protein
MSLESSRIAAYMTLVHKTQEQVSWLRMDEAQVIGITEALGKAVIDAIAIGLTPDIIQIALRIGEFYGQHQPKFDLTNATPLADATVRQDSFGEYVPVAWLSKSDLLFACEEFAQEIETLDEADLVYLAKKLGDALQEVYFIAIPIILTQLFNSK